MLALTTLGLAVVFGMLGVMNMAHGEFVMLGAYAVVTVQKAWGCRSGSACRWRSRSASSLG